MANIADADTLDEAEEGAASAKPKSRFAIKLAKKQLVMLACGALALVGIAGGYFYFFAAAPSEEAAHEEKHAVVFVDLPDMLVNLSAPADRPKYLKLKIALEISNEQAAEQVRPLLPRVTDSFQTHIREMRSEDLDGSAGMYRLKEELLRRINQAVYPAKVDAILFKELLLQ